MNLGEGKTLEMLVVIHSVKCYHADVGILDCVAVESCG